MPANISTSKQKNIALGAALLAAFLILVLTLTPAPVNTQAAANVQPALLAMAVEKPDEPVRVIIQKSAPTADIESLVTGLGGAVIKDLHIINAIVAEMEAETAVDIALDASVNWVSLDSPVEKSQTNETFTVRDEFNNDSSEKSPSRLKVQLFVSTEIFS